MLLNNVEDGSSPSKVQVLPEIFIIFRRQWRQPEDVTFVWERDSYDFRLHVHA